MNLINQNEVKEDLDQQENKQNYGCGKENSTIRNNLKENIKSYSNKVLSEYLEYEFIADKEEYKLPVEWPWEKVDKTPEDEKWLDKLRDNIEPLLKGFRE